MQLIGFFLLAFVVWLGFTERGGDQTVSAWDWHAFVIVLVGCGAAVMASSSSKTALRTLLFLRELVPGLRRMGAETAQMETEREQLGNLRFVVLAGCREQRDDEHRQDHHPRTG